MALGDMSVQRRFWPGKPTWVAHSGDCVMAQRHSSSRKLRNVSEALSTLGGVEAGFASAAREGAARKVRATSAILQNKAVRTRRSIRDSSRSHARRLAKT